MDIKLREEITNLHAQFCKALADPNRILLLYTLSGHSYMVSDLAEMLGLPQPTVSRHLKILRERSMVSARRDGQAVFYMLADDRIIQALDLLRAVMADALRTQVALADSTYESLGS